MEDVLFHSISEVSSLYRQKELSPVEVLRQTLEQLEKWEPHLNAFVSVFAEDAFREAEAAEKAFLRGESLAPLAGIPVSVKDLFYTKDRLTTCGARIMNQFRPTHDATVVENLQNAGAVLFGKTNMLEFAYGIVHPDFGQTNNPWDVQRTAGGSSSGSAAAVAAGIGYASLGTDTGGSIRIPASYCGVVGVKPTYGLVSTYGVFPLSWSLDHVGPLARSVQDAALLLDVIAGYDARDAYSSQSALGWQSCAAGIGQEVANKRIGVLPAQELTHLTNEVRAAYERSLRVLQAAGFELVEVEIPDFRQSEEALMRVLLPEAAHVHRHYWAQRTEYAAHTLLQIEQGRQQSAVVYLAGSRAQEAFTKQVAAVFAEVVALVMPTVAFPAPAEDPVIGDESMNEVIFTGPFNVSGHPAVSVNCGFTAEGLPVGLQFVGPHFGERELLQVAHRFEQAAGVQGRPHLP